MALYVFESVELELGLALDDDDDDDDTYTCPIYLHHDGWTVSRYADCYNISWAVHACMTGKLKFA